MIWIRLPACMSHQQEQDIKRKIPWDDIDTKILETVRFANTIPGITTVYSCAGHIKPDKVDIFVQHAFLMFWSTKDCTPEQVLDAAQQVGISDVSFRLSDGSFWVHLSGIESGERGKLMEFLKVLKAVNDD